MGVLNWLDPHVDQYISSTADEQKVLEVKKHWAASAWAYVRLAIAVVIFISAFAYQAPVYYVFVVIGLALGLQALWHILEEYRDRFVITNQRVFRVNGILSTARASVPLSENLGYHCQQARHRPLAELRTFRLRVRRAGPGLERDQVRREHRSARAMCCAW